MDNASFHYSERIKEMYLRAVVELLYLPPYSPDLNPIEEFFAELKTFIKKQWPEYESSPASGVWSISRVVRRGGRREAR
jgi:transposase